MGLPPSPALSGPTYVHSASWSLTSTHCPLRFSLNSQPCTSHPGKLLRDVSWSPSLFSYRILLKCHFIREDLASQQDTQLLALLVSLPCIFINSLCFIHFSVPSAQQIFIQWLNKQGHSNISCTTSGRQYDTCKKYCLLNPILNYSLCAWPWD